MQQTNKSKALIAQIMTYGLNRVRSARRREDVEAAMEESLMEVMPRLEKRTHYLATFANIATLARTAGHDYRPDQRVHGCVERESGGKG